MAHRMPVCLVPWYHNNSTMGSPEDDPYLKCGGSRVGSEARNACRIFIIMRRTRDFVIEFWRFFMVKVAPSILSADFVNLERDIRKLSETGTDYVHVDVMDGNFVPNITIGIPVVAAIRRITDLPLDVHLMIDRPVRYVDDFCKAGANIVTVHVEADTEENTLEALRRIKANGVRAGVVVKPKTPAEAVLPFLSLCDLILVMTVEPGFGGQSFMADMMPKLKQISRYIAEQKPDCELEVDGGVNEKTAMICRENGANVLVAGSAYFKSADPAAFNAAVKA